MQTGIGKVDITPGHNVDLGGFRIREQPMTGVLDRLFVRTVAFEDQAGSRAIIAVADSLGVVDETAQAIRAEAHSRFGLDESSIHLVATHTHSAPCMVALRDCGDIDPSYAQQFIGGTMESIEAALDRLRPAHFAVSRSVIELARDRRLGGKLHNPVARSPQLDPEALTLWLYEQDVSRPFAAFVNYACHAVVMSGRMVSADWPGATCSALEGMCDGDFIAVVMPGGSANLNPIYRNEAAFLAKMGDALADSVSRATREPISAGGAVTNRSTPYRLEFCAPKEEQLEVDAEALVQASLSMPAMRESCLKWAKDRLEELRSGRLTLRLGVTLNVLHVGELRFAFLPFETFSETARYIKAAAPGRTFVASCADGIIGYLPIESAYEEGGYEVTTAHRFYDRLLIRPGSAEEVAEVIRSLL